MHNGNNSKRKNKGLNVGREFWYICINSASRDIELICLIQRQFAMDSIVFRSS
jgi:hypothetical protein